MKVCELRYVMDRLTSYGLEELEVRIGDVSEGSDLHASLGRASLRNGSVVLCAGDDDVWKDETLSSELLESELHPEFDEERIAHYADALEEAEQRQGKKL